MQDQTPILTVNNLHKRFPLEKKLFGESRQHIYAVNGVSFQLHRGRTTGLVGESGCGKSTVGKLICKLEEPDRGAILFDGENIQSFSGGRKLNYHRRVQMIFQNPYTSLNPRQRIERGLTEIFRVHQICKKSEIPGEINRVLSSVGLPEESRRRYPFEFSGGQRQRLCIARALTVQPEVIVCDEPVSALDVSIQAQILKLLKDLQEQHQLTYLFISHDLSVVYHICDEVLIMYLGMIVERGTVETIFHHPAHPYTEALLSAIPMPDPQTRRKRIVLSGEIPSPTHLPPGCPFFSRCSQRKPVCEKEMPPVTRLDKEHQVSCWLYKESS